MPRKKPKPKNTEDLPRELVRKVMRAMASKGGKVRGKCKARTSEQARAAVNARWARQREKEAEKVDTPPSGECQPPPSTQN